MIFVSLGLIAVNVLISGLSYVPLNASATIATQTVAMPITTTTQDIPTNLFMPPNPPPPGREKAHSLKLNYVLTERTTNYRHASPSQAKNIELVAHRLNGVVVNPGQTFSYYKCVGPYTQQNGFGWGRAFAGDRIIPSMGGGVCQGASTLYSALLKTELAIVERHRHGLTVPYLPPGEDATVAASANLDFRFKNNQASPILIAAAADSDKRFLTISVWGAKPAPEIQVKHRILAKYPYQTIQKMNPKLDTGSKVLFPGQFGAKVQTWVELKSEDKMIRREIGVDVYRASPRVIEVRPNHG